MKPQIQYAQTSDGVNIAYCAMGEGAPLVYASNLFGDIHWYTYNDATRTQVDAMAAAGWRIIKYDGRGMGSSDREVADFSLEARLRDLEAVVDHMALERFPLCGVLQGGPTAILYSLRHPERVSHLVLVNSFASGSAYYEKIPAMRTIIGLRGMAEEQWDFFTLTLASAIRGFGDAVVAQKTAAMFRSSMSPAAFLSYVEEAGKIDLLDALSGVSVPTLVVVDTSGFVTDDVIRPLATRIPGARLLSTDGYAQEVTSFLGGGTHPRATPALPSGTAVILFADIVDSTAMTERIGDAAFRAKARDLDASMRRIITEAGGTTIDAKTLGDGVLATFPAASQAIDAALRCAASGGEFGLQLHLGLHAGDVIREANNVFGGAVNIASRISGLSAPDELLVSATVRELARTSAGVEFDDRGEHALKGVGEAVRVFAVRAREGA
jgi:class 3 adenylate cyclase